MMAELKVHRLVRREVRDAFDWYLVRDPRAAIRLLDEIWHGYNQIASCPYRWPVEDGDYRYYPLRRFPFRIIYRRHEDWIRIVAFAHAKRRPGYWKRRK
jgi:plasmid stabilization system protein ParE